MAAFILIPLNDSIAKKLPELIGDKIGDKKRTYALPRGEWLVSYEGTSRQLFEELGVEDEIVVLNFSGYWGVASQDLWDWISFYQKINAQQQTVAN